MVRDEDEIWAGKTCESQGILSSRYSGHPDYRPMNDRFAVEAIDYQGSHSTWKPAKPVNVMKFQRTCKNHRKFIDFLTKSREHLKRFIWFVSHQQRACELKFVHYFIINFIFAKWKVTFCIKHFLNSPTVHEGSNHFWFTHKESHLIIGFSFRVHKLERLHDFYSYTNQSKKSREVDAITWILRKIRISPPILAAFEN